MEPGSGTLEVAERAAPDKDLSWGLPLRLPAGEGPLASMGGAPGTSGSLGGRRGT
jgi:hypothetical protein